MPNPSKTLILPVDLWETFIDESRSVDMFMNAPKDETGKAVSVRSAVLESMRLVTNGVGHGSIETSVASCWSIVPHELFSGETYKALGEKLRFDMKDEDRGNHRGGIVSVRGKEFVLNEYVEVRTTYPNAHCAITEAVAQEYFENEESGYFKEFHPLIGWELFHGNPVAIVKARWDGEPDFGLMYWRHGKRINRMCVKDLDTARSNSKTSIDRHTVLNNAASEQLALF